jgi:hypothetical protein
MTDEERSQIIEANFRPSFLIPPYFLNTSDNANTFNLNQKILKYCSESDNNLYYDIFPMILVSKDVLLDDNFLNRIIACYKKYKFKGYCLWIEGFDERTVSKKLIKKLIYLIRELSENRSKQVITLYGGFYSLLLYYFGLTCSCHGLAYGESRSVYAAAKGDSGPVPVRYYVMDIHSFLTLENALAILRKRDDMLCDCPICQRIIRGNPENVILLEKESSLAEMHFLWNRYQERKLIASSSYSEIIQHLEWIIELNDDLPKITKQYRINNGFINRSIIDLEYIKHWKSALETETPL